MLITKGVVVLFVLTIAGPYFPGGGRTGLAAAEEIYRGQWFGRTIDLSDEDQTYLWPTDLSTQLPVNQKPDSKLPEVHIFIDEKLACELVHHESHNRNRRSFDIDNNSKNDNINENDIYNGKLASARAAQPLCDYGPFYGYRPCYQRYN